MEQRPLRLGDIVDDYCPRERRITNHAVVALVGDDIRQTRCTTCDVEHVYKQARVPKRVTGSKDAGITDNGSGQLVPKAAAAAAPAKDEPVAESNGSRPETTEPADAPPDRPAQNGDLPRDVDGWLAHRPLIRASLPRTDGEPPAPRPIPEFTMHRQAYGRPFRGQGRHGNGHASNGFDHGRHGNGNGDDNRGNHGNHGNHGGYGNGNAGNGQPRPGGGGGRRRRRRGGRHKQSH